MSYWREGYILLEAMYYIRACLTGGHVLQEYMYCEMTCITEKRDLK